ncbi:hypothetical protein CATMIT_01958, partial [Catenibacterium mitsuokai DSM 15897]
HDHVAHVVQGQQEALDLDREHLLAGDVDDFRFAAEDLEVIAVDLDPVAGVVPALLVERAGRVEIAEHGLLAADPQGAVAHFQLEAVAADLHPLGRGIARLGGEDAELGQAVGLLQRDVREGAVQAGQGRVGHDLGAVGDDLERGQVVLAMDLRHQQHGQERRRGRQQLDRVALDRRAD